MKEKKKTVTVNIRDAKCLKSKLCNLLEVGGKRKHFSQWTAQIGCYFMYIQEAYFSSDFFFFFFKQRKKRQRRFLHFCDKILYNINSYS